MAKDLNPKEFKGFYIQDDQFNRVSVTSIEYFRHHLKLPIFDYDFTYSLQLNDPDIYLIILRNKQEKFSFYLPEYEKNFKEISNKIDEFTKKMLIEFEKYKYTENQKEYAIQITNNIHKDYKDMFFNLKKNMTIIEYLYSMKNPSLDFILEK